MGPLPAISDLQAQDGDVVTYLSARTDKTGIIYTGVTSGRAYEVYATGTWSQDATDDKYLCGPGGNPPGGIGTISDAGAAFHGFYYGMFAIKEPGVSTWVSANSYYVIRATAAGNLLGSFADLTGLWGDNGGYMTVLVRPL